MVKRPNYIVVIIFPIFFSSTNILTFNSKVSQKKITDRGPSINDVMALGGEGLKDLDTSILKPLD